MKKSALLLSLILSSALLAGCGDNTSSQQATASQDKPAEIVPSVPIKDHQYSMKDGFEYGYEQGLSENQQNAGQVASTLLMFKYAGQKDGAFQVYTKDAVNEVIAVMQCSNPCDFMKVMTFYQGENIKTERMRATEGSIGWAVMSDAINGKLQQYFVDKNGKKLAIWFDEKKGITSTPVSQ